MADGGMDPDQKGAWCIGATLAFTDECGFQMDPVRRRTLAVRGQTPSLPQREGHRHKVSVAAALCRSPIQGRGRLLYQTYPDWSVDSWLYAEFILDLVHRVRGPIVLLHDHGSIHRGEWMDEVLEDFPSLQVREFPTYAPQLNPVEYVFAHTKGHDMANFAPEAVSELDDMLNGKLLTLSRDQNLLQSCFQKATLTW